MWLKSLCASHAKKISTLFNCHHSYNLMVSSIQRVIPICLQFKMEIQFVNNWYHHNCLCRSTNLTWVGSYGIVGQVVSIPVVFWNLSHWFLEEVHYDRHGLNSCVPFISYYYFYYKHTRHDKFINKQKWNIETNITVDSFLKMGVVYVGCPSWAQRCVVVYVGSWFI